VKSKRTKSFKKLFDKFPDYIQENARKQYKMFRENPAHPSLRIKQIGTSKNKALKIYEASIGMGYRATYFVDKDVYVWFWIGTHESFDKRY